MGQFSEVLLAIENVLDCGPGVGGLSWTYEQNYPTHSLTLFRVYVASISTSLPHVQIGISMIS